jgi:hypothetical protein
VLINVRSPFGSRYVKLDVKDFSATFAKLNIMVQSLFDCYDQHPMIFKDAFVPPFQYYYSDFLVVYFSAQGDTFEWERISVGGKHYGVLISQESRTIPGVAPTIES